MIARCRAKTCVVHLKTDGEDEDAPVMANAQRGIKGHVIIHPQRPEKLASVLPPPVEEIMAPICVIFIGSKVPSREWLEKKAKPLIVRREYVVAALSWLKENNPLYSEVEVDMESIRSLPEDGILPHDIQHLQSFESSTAVVDGYDVARDVPISGGDAEDVPFHKVVVTDVDGRAPANELRAAAIRHIKHKGGGYVEIPHASKPVNEFCNPELFPMIYPTLYPYGIGGFEDRECLRPLSLKRHIRH
ncbi:hypothetical protein FKP32DRAFT_1534638, partial [Trametes sanguinea]